jgi:hypothetical protein
MCNAIESVAGPQLFGVCFSHGGAARRAVGGTGAGVGSTVGTTVGAEAGGAATVAVMAVGTSVTGKLVGTGPGGLTTFRTYIVNLSYRQSNRLFTAGIWYSAPPISTIPARPATKILPRVNMSKVYQDSMSEFLSSRPLARAGYFLSVIEQG